MKRPLTLLIFICCILTIKAQPGQLVLHSIDLPARFEQQIIISLEQDKLGMLWFVTNEGLFRFDGNEVVHLGPETKPGIPHSNIKALFADSNGNLWVGAQDGVTRLNLKSWHTTELKFPAGTDALSRYIRTMAEDNNGTVYAGSQNGKVYKIQKDSLVCIFDMNTAFKDLYDLPNITFIKQTGGHQLWFGTSVGKMVRLDILKDGKYGPPKFYGQDLFKKEQIVAASFGPKGNCIISVPNLGLFYLEAFTGEIRKIKGPYGELGAHGQVFMVPLDSVRTILMTNTPGIGKEKLFIYDFSKNDFSVQDLHYPRFLEENHIVWLSHTGSKILLSLNDYLLELAPSTSPFETLMAEPKSLNSIRAIYKPTSGPLLVGSYKDGFVKYNEQTGDKEVIARKYVYSILPWNKDSVVLSTEGDGLFWYEIAKNKLTPIDFESDQIQGKPMGKFLTFLTRHDSNHFLVGTYERLYMVNPYQHTARSIREDRLLKTKVLNILKRKSDYLIGTEHNILKWNYKTDSIAVFSRHGQYENQASLSVYGMLEVDHNIWAATSGTGIIIFDQNGKAIDTLTKKDGLAANIVFTLAATDKYVLAGTKNGLSIIDKQRHHITNYSTIDQLPANEFNSAAIYQGSGKVYLGTIDGVVRFKMDQLKGELFKNKIKDLYITDLVITDKKGHSFYDYTLPYQKIKTDIKIPAGTSYFSIGFGSMYQSMKYLDYYYRLDKEQQWISVGNGGKISFIGMPPGKYQLEMVAKLPDGHWSNNLLSLPIIVEPAFYQTIWFKLLMGILVMALIWLLIKYREKQAEKERSLRLKIAGDLHDEIGSTLAGMSMQAEMLLNGHRQHQDTYLKSIADNGRAAVQTMGDIVWSIDPRNDDSLSLFQRIERYGNKVLGETDITIQFESHGVNEKQFIPQKIRQNAMLIFKEAITNIIKHSKATRVVVVFSAYDNGFKLSIEDNGKGMASISVEDNHFPSVGHGLRNMEMRAELMGAELFFPAISKGFKILLICKGE
ncbi:sensor histidine kinase [Arachidicoccus rhizosphaerae]|nr:two-component regulator propeller domain-containing protein [Arachidicoccus rhizosphaerae]